MSHSPGRLRVILASSALLASTALSNAVPALAAGGTTYYVDASAGNDAAAGTSTATPWRSLAKINQTTFAAGDKILLHAGQTWAGQLHPLGSGAAGAPIVISGYGTGAKPKIDGATLASGAAVRLANQSYVTIDGLQVTSNSGKDNLGTLTTPGSSRDGILVSNETGTTLHGITIQNNDVSNVNGCYSCTDVDPHDNGGIVVDADITAPFLAWWGTSSYDGVLIKNNTVTNVGRTGIYFYDRSTGNLTLDANALSTNVSIVGNTLQHIDSDGIELWGAKYPLLQANVVGYAGAKTIQGFSAEPSAAGLWPVHTIGAVVQFNEVYGTRTQNDVDGQGFDNDGLAIGSVFEHNYSHDNEGGFMLMEGITGTSDLTVRYNLSVNDGWGGRKGVFTFAVNVMPSISIYNNTVHIPTGSPVKLFYSDGFTPNSGTPAYSFRNNVIANFGSGAQDAPNGAGTVIDSNLFWGNHPASEPADAHKLTSDPKFVGLPSTAPLGRAATTGYQVQAGSPAVGSGAVVTGNGGFDFFGRPLSATAAPSRGFFEARNF